MESDIDKFYLSSKDLWETKYQVSINKRESTPLNYLNDSKAFIEYSNDIDHIYKNIEDYTPNKKRKILIGLDDLIIAGMVSNNKFNPVITELFITGGKLNIAIAFIPQSYFAVRRSIRLISTLYFVKNFS